MWSRYAYGVEEDVRIPLEWPCPCEDIQGVDRACTWDDGTEVADDEGDHGAVHRDAEDGMHGAWPASGVVEACGLWEVSSWTVDDDLRTQMRLPGPGWDFWLAAHHQSPAFPSRLHQPLEPQARIHVDP